MRCCCVLKFLFLGCIISFASLDATAVEDTMLVKKTDDFTISGKGDNEAWSKTKWENFNRIDSGGKDYKSRSKMLYSAKGIYLLLEGEDETVTTKDYKDDEEIYEGDVFEFFLQTEKGKAYFEYEINQLGKQLVLTLSGTPHKNMAWSPWGHEFKRRDVIQRKVVVTDKDNKVLKNIKPGNKIRSWSAELFFPYEIISLLPNAIPKSGTIWWGHPCRIDYDSGKMIQWSWSKKIEKDFHELRNFGTILFE